MEDKTYIGWTDEIAAQKERLFAWVPVVVGAGIALYFCLREEPPLWLCVASAFSLWPLAVWSYRRQFESTKRFFLFLACIALSLTATGFLAAQIGTKFAGTPILKKSLGPVIVAGRVERVEALGGKDGSRVLLRELRIEDILPEETPRKIRLRFKKDAELAPGQIISTLAKIDPPSIAVMPGAYDFRRHLFFDGIGGVGFSYKQPTIENAEPGGKGLFFEHLRDTINDHIRTESGEATSGIMTALITGERGTIAEEDDNAMRDSGLYHLLSISGTHVTLVAGVLFFFSRFFLACFPWAALHWPIKKIAACIAMAGAGFYVVLAGAEIPAVRALVMTALIMMAILLDRSPFSLRLIAFAALLVLLTAPWALVGVSFQMSFAAVAALICFFEWIRPWWLSWYSRAGFVRRSIMYLIGILMTSVIAGSVTGLFGLYHFQSFAAYGILANMFAVPLTGLVIMPAAVGAMMLMPFGMEGPALAIMSWGTEWLLSIAHWAAKLEGAVLHVRQWPEITFVLISSGLVLFLVWQGWRGKAVAGLLITIGLVFPVISPSPDILVSGTGKLVAVRDGEKLYLSAPRREKFTSENWTRLLGLQKESMVAFKSPNAPFLCDDTACRIERDGRKISIVRHPSALTEDCRWADLVIAEIPVKKATCMAKTLSLYDFKDKGAHTVILGQNIMVKSVSGHQKRPWN